MKFNKISSNTFRELQLGAGVLLNSFDPDDPQEPTDETILFATSGGITISAVPTMDDLGADIDNCPANTAELQRITDWECTVSTTALSVSPAALKLALGAADIINEQKVAPRKNLTIADYASELWWVGEQGENGLVAVKISNAISTGGLTLTTTNDGKGTLALTIKGFSRLSAPDVVPMEFYSSASSVEPSITLDRSSAAVVEGGTITLTATVVPLGAEVTWTSSNTSRATVAAGVVTGVARGNATITASITVDGSTYSATCSIDVEPSITLDRNGAEIAVGGTTTLTATVVPLGAEVTWTSSNTSHATVAAGVVTGVAEGTATITASITVDETTYSATCNIIVSEQ